jgi:hypothetical protein
MGSAGSIVRRPMVILLIIVAIVLVAFLLYTLIHFGSQSYKIDNYDALWNQSLADLRSGNMTVGEYCINRIHDVDLCNRFNNLEYLN